MYKLIEFKNHQKETLRGLLTINNSTSGIIFLHGFEHTSIEPKFKNIIDKLKGEVNTLRFDFSGCGLSDGQFSDISVEKLSNELDSAIKAFKKVIPKLKKIHLIGHSLAGCVIVNYLQEKNSLIDKVVLMGPALNQSGLLRYYFTRSLFVGKKYISWNNWQENFSENKFQLWLKKKNKMRKAHYINNDYFVENESLDYQDMFGTLALPIENLLIILGGKDDKVPITSLNKLPKSVRKLIIKESDHTFEKPTWVEQYLPQLITFLKK